MLSRMTGFDLRPLISMNFLFEFSTMLLVNWKISVVDSDPALIVSVFTPHLSNVHRLTVTFELSRKNTLHDLVTSSKRNVQSTSSSDET